MVYTSSCVGADLLLCKNNYTHFIAVSVDKAILLPWTRMHSRVIMFGHVDVCVYMYVYIWSNLTVHKIATKAYILLALKIYVTNLDLASHRLSTRSVFLLPQCGSQWCLNAHVITALIIERLSHPHLLACLRTQEKPNPTWQQCIIELTVQHSPLTVLTCVLWCSSSFHAN